jgi:hypothetical protein
VEAVAEIATAVAAAVGTRISEPMHRDAACCVFTLL